MCYNYDCVSESTVSVNGFVTENASIRMFSFLFCFKEKLYKVACCVLVFN